MDFKKVEFLLRNIINRLSKGGGYTNHLYICFLGLFIDIFLKNAPISIFLLSSTYIRRKYWIRENFRLPVFDGFTCFEMS